jgi:hypothetical protein
MTGNLAASPAQDHEASVDQRAMIAEEADELRDLPGEEVQPLSVGAGIVAGLQIGEGCSDRPGCLQDYFCKNYTDHDIKKCNR